MASKGSGGPFKDPTKEVDTTQAQAVTDTSASSLREQVAQKYGSTDEHVFSDPSVADHWRKVYEKAQYENRHRFDPNYQWSAEDERKLVRKLIGDDQVMFCALDLHRRNINRAISDNMVRDLQQTTRNGRRLTWQ
ncbi:allantoate permease [Colletotrichum tofieldiae]|nr:allantoate permease [Colletotrichum tofieldiae]